MKTSNSQLHFPSEPLQNRQIKLPIGAVFRKVLQYFAQFLVSDSEPRVWTTTDRYGNTYWHGYDPVCGKSTSLCSEAEIRAWLERRYYQ